MTDVIRVTSRPTFRDLAGRFTRATAEVIKEKRDAMRRLGARMVALMREEAPMKTGKFRRSIIYRSFETGDNVGFNVYTQQPLGTWIVGGTRAHIIAAKRAKTLAFWWENGPRGPGMYFYPSVHHPGTQPNPYHERAYGKWKPEAALELRRISTRYVSILQGKS